MNTNYRNNSSSEETLDTLSQDSGKQAYHAPPYHAPQLKIHGRLERLTLQEGGTSVVIEDPGGN